jgi:tyrosyl-tRNA synthetase
MEQFFKVVDKERTEVRWQGEWYGKFTLADVIQLTSKFTIAQLLARDDFSDRYSAGRPISIVELLYPLLQAYDSVAVEADVEFGGTDQKFNLLVGRELQSMVGQRPQQLFLVPILVGTDGSQKMSKSLGNYIGVAEPPEEMYGKVMSISDSLIMDYFELLTDVPDGELDEFRRAMTDDKVNPMELKKRLAGEIVTQLYDRKAADGAEEHFERVFQKRKIPEEIEEKRVSLKKLMYPDGSVNVGRLLIDMGLVKSRSEANRLINQGAVNIDNVRITKIGWEVKNNSIINVGKLRFAKVINSDILNI